MRATNDNSSFYANIPIFSHFGNVMEQAFYARLPDDWTIGVSDIVQSTKAIRERGYRAVNMAGAAVIAATKNALDGRDFPYVFGGDGAAIAVPPRDLEGARAALAATATWVKNEIGLVMRVALVPIASIRAHGFDVRVARFAPSPNVSYAMFSGGGLRWADAAMKRGEFAVLPGPPDARPNLTGLSCRFSEIPAARGLVLSLLVVPAMGTSPEAFRIVIEEVIALVEHSPGGSTPIPTAGPTLGWPPAGAGLEARAVRRRGVPLFIQQGVVLAWNFIYFIIMRYGIRVGNFVPAVYLRQVIENADYRKFDDGLRMVIDCGADLADAIERRLVAAAEAGAACYGLHRQDAALMTCFAPSPVEPNHVHFIHGARGYSSAATALKAMLG
ncbi:MAG: DUF3095 domain-containing protein [Rhodoplanes sp.]